VPDGPLTVQMRIALKPAAAAQGQRAGRGGRDVRENSAVCRIDDRIGGDKPIDHQNQSMFVVVVCCGWTASIDLSRSSIVSLLLCGLSSIHSLLLCGPSSIHSLLLCGLGCNRVRCLCRVSLVQCKGDPRCVNGGDDVMCWPVGVDGA